ncbi:PAS domain-containing protein [Chelatococcus sambhunathii]|uniref:histidine kinase n=1 Tax=Chelatococcus sambhunathii TaxID=363953 RepID=A0ABU1DCI9_9HYPH|nr:PAS domain-containing protein [Chelatococcus sambhunathii]MDR4305828.1 PAS domain-containing protein [Chelatococcus sambhunathii]
MSSVADRSTPPAEPAIDRSGRTGSIGLVVLLAAALVGAGLAISFLKGEAAQPWILGLLAVLSVIGVFALFAGAVGVIQLSTRGARDDLARGIVAGDEDGVLVTDHAGRIVFANEAYLDLTRAENAASARTVERVFAGNPDVAEAIYRLAQAARSGKRAFEEARATLPDGRGAWFRIGVRPISRAGQTEIVWTLSDVTGERERHEGVFQELQHAVDFLDHAPAGFFAAGGDGSIVYMNATLADWLGQDLTRVGPGALRLGDILAGEGAALVEAVAPKPGATSTEIIDVDLKARGGRAAPARLLHAVSWGADGTPGASRTLVLDRGPGADVSEPLRAAEVRFARFFNNTPLAIATVDSKGRIARANAPFARLFGDRLKAEGESRSVYACLAQERDRAALEAAVKAAARGEGEIAPVEATLPGEGGRSATLFVTRVDDRDGDDEAAVVYALDTTDQRALEAKFAQSQKMNAVGQLAGGVAHDFNNVLTAIIGYSDLLLANHRPTDPSFQDIMQIKQNANRAASLVRQLLAFSRRQTLRPQVIALGDTLADLRMLLSRLLGEKIKLEVVQGRDLWLVKADLNQFEQVVINLAVNARDAIIEHDPDGGAVTIRTRNVPAAEIAALGHPEVPQADFVLIDVEDTGPGIPDKIIDQIFEPFFSTKEVGKGTGLGLSTVYGIVKQTDGYVYALSEPGKGATFRILIPRHVAAEGEEAKPQAAAAQAAQDMTGSGVVLLVEDEDAVRAFGARALASRGYTVLEARSGVEALELMKEHAGEVQLVVSDVVMPEMDGPSLLRELRKAQPELKIIFVSGYAEDAFKKNLPEGEKFSFLPKPFSLKQLVQAVKETMGPGGSDGA